MTEWYMEITRVGRWRHEVQLRARAASGFEIDGRRTTVWGRARAERYAREVLRDLFDSPPAREVVATIRREEPDQKSDAA